MSEDVKKAESTSQPLEAVQGLVIVRELETGKETQVFPIDGKELVAGGGYEYVTDDNGKNKITAGKPGKEVVSGEGGKGDADGDKKPDPNAADPRAKGGKKR